MNMRLFNYPWLGAAIIACLLFSGNARAQYVTIPDNSFVNWLDTSGYASCMNGNQMDTTCSAILNAQAAYCNGVPIRNLSGIQYFKSLYFLNCAGDSLTVIPALPAGLGFFSCQNNKLQSLPALPTGLTNFICSFNQLSVLPALPASLITFSCGSNQLTSLPAIPPRVEDLSCDHNQLTTLPRLSASLQSLNCQGNPQLACLPQLYNMSYINFDSTAITCLPNYFQVNSSVPPLDTIPLCSATGSGCPSFTAISAIAQNISIKLFPNPAQNYVVVEAGENAIGGMLYITDITGREIEKMPITNARSGIPTSTLISAVYFLKVVDLNGGVGVSKLIVAGR